MHEKWNILDGTNSNSSFIEPNDSNNDDNLIRNDFFELGDKPFV